MLLSFTFYILYTKFISVLLKDIGKFYILYTNILVRDVSGSGQSDKPDKFEPNQLNWFVSIRFIGSIGSDPIGTDQYSVRVSD